MKGFYDWTGLYSGNDNPLKDFQKWVSRAWFKIAGGGNEAHLRAGTNVVESTSDCARYFAYMLKEKGRQNTVPEGFGDAGRFWGVWGYRAEWHGALLSEDEFVTLRRTVRAWERSKGWFADDLGHLSPRHGIYPRKRRLSRGGGYGF